MSIKNKLRTEVERQLYDFVNQIKEHVQDYTVLTIRKRTGEQFDRDQLTRTLDIVRAAIDDAFMTKIERFMTKLDKSLETFAEVHQANDPLDHMVRSQADATTSKKGRPRKNA